MSTNQQISIIIAEIQEEIILEVKLLKLHNSLKKLFMGL